MDKEEKGIFATHHLERPLRLQSAWDLDLDVAGGQDEFHWQVGLSMTSNTLAVSSKQ